MPSASEIALSGAAAIGLARSCAHGGRGSCTEQLTELVRAQGARDQTTVRWVTVRPRTASGQNIAVHQVGAAVLVAAGWNERVVARIPVFGSGDLDRRYREIPAC